MTAKEIRESFKKFFESKGHLPVLHPQGQDGLRLGEPPQKGGQTAAALHLKLAAVLALFPDAVHLHLHRIGLRQVIPHRREPDQMVSVGVGATSLLGDHNVCGLHPQDGVLAGGVEKQNLIKCRYDTHCFASPPLIFYAASGTVRFT